PSLKDKVAIVTDIGSETGQAIAARFIAEGAQVGGCRAAGVRADAMPKSLPEGVLPFDGNLAVPADAQRMVASVIQRFGRLDVLVNHGAGGRFVGTVVDAKEEDLREVMAGDVWSVIALSAAAIPEMR